MAWNHRSNINKNNSKNNHNNFCLTSCARIYPKPSTIDMKWTLIKDLGKACCNLQSKNKWVIKMSSFRGVASVLQGGAPKKNVSKRGYSPDWHDNLHAVFCLKEGLKKGGGVHKHPRTPLAMSLSCDSRFPFPPGNFLLWLLSYPQNLPESLWPMRATHHTLVKHLMLPPLPPPFLAKRCKHFSVSTTKE